MVHGLFMGPAGFSLRACISPFVWTTGSRPNNRRDSSPCYFKIEDRIRSCEVETGRIEVSDGTCLDAFPPLRMSLPPSSALKLVHHPGERRGMTGGLKKDGILI
jgi:hypothetical protein